MELDELEAVTWELVVEPEPEEDGVGDGDGDGVGQPMMEGDVRAQPSMG
jgi:hypothetical protein